MIVRPGHWQNGEIKECLLDFVLKHVPQHLFLLAYVLTLIDHKGKNIPLSRTSQLI